MVDGQDANFDPADINEKAIVVGSNGAGMVLRVPGQTDLVFAGSYPIAINDHARPAPAESVESAELAGSRTMRMLAPSGSAPTASLNTTTRRPQQPRPWAHRPCESWLSHLQ